jgi:protein-L-isoaspartate(D-aspartate) O-methyltransferase
MVKRQIAARGISDARVLAAMERVPRDRFVPESQREFAYEDSALPIEEEQTISQPYIVALMAEALRLSSGARVLEVGTGSGYSAAVLAELAEQVFTIERQAGLAASAAQRLATLGYVNVRGRHADGTLGWGEHAPFDGIVVAAGGPDVPPALLQQLAVGGRLVMPIGRATRLQTLVRVTRVGPERYEREDLGAVRFVPLIGAQGWGAAGPNHALSRLIADCAEAIDDLDSPSLAALLERVGDAEVVLLGDSTHGSAEFQTMRARITQALVLRRGFRAVAIAGDWPDAAQVDRNLRYLPPLGRPIEPFARFPRWLWRNLEFTELLLWLREHNRETVDTELRVRLCGLDVYSLHASRAALLDHLDRVDADVAAIARERYGALTPWQGDPAAYGRAALSERYRAHEEAVVTLLCDLHARRSDYIARESELWFDRGRNARLLANAERYYRALFYGAAESWNLREQHMFESLRGLRACLPGVKVVVWEHNAHVGDASATEMGGRGEHNIGQMCRQILGEGAYSIGFGTHHGTVAAADEWGERMRVVNLRPAFADSYERLFHDSALPALLLPLKHAARDALRSELEVPRLQRAIGFVYRPESEIESHYFQASLSRQFDEYVWFDETRAVRPLEGSGLGSSRLAHPLGV